MSFTRNSTLTSTYQMRKPRHQKNVSGQGNLQSAATNASTSGNEGLWKSRSPIVNRLTRNKAVTKRESCLKRQIQCMKDTTAVILSSSPEPPTEITWDFQSQVPENVIKPASRSSETDTTSVLSLMKQVFPETKPQQAKYENSYLELWLAKREGIGVKIPVKNHAMKSDVHSSSQSHSKYQVAAELKQLMDHVENVTVAMGNNDHGRGNNISDRSQRSNPVDHNDAYKHNSNFKVPYQYRIATNSSDMLNGEESDASTQLLYTNAHNSQNNSSVSNEHASKMQEIIGARPSRDDFVGIGTTSNEGRTEPTSINANTSVQLSTVSSGLSRAVINSQMATTLRPIDQWPLTKPQLEFEHENAAVVPGCRSRNPLKENHWMRTSALSVDGTQAQSSRKEETGMDCLDDIMTCATQQYPSDSENCPLNGSNLLVNGRSGPGGRGHSSSFDEDSGDGMWANEDIFNDEQFILATQHLFTATSNQQVPHSTGTHNNKPLSKPLETKSQDRFDNFGCSSLVSSSSSNTHSNGNSLTSASLTAKAVATVRPVVQHLSVKGSKPENITTLSTFSSNRMMLKKHVQCIEATAFPARNSQNDDLLKERDSEDSDDIMNCATQPYSDPNLSSGSHAALQNESVIPENSVPYTSLGNDSLDMWDNEDIFNDEVIILATQRQFSDTAVQQNSNFNGVFGAKPLSKLPEMQSIALALKEAGSSVLPNSSYCSQPTMLHCNSSVITAGCSYKTSHDKHARSSASVYNNTPISRGIRMKQQHVLNSNILPKHKTTILQPNQSKSFMNGSKFIQQDKAAMQEDIPPHIRANNSSDEVWDNEELFNDEEFILATQQFFSGNLYMRDSSFNTVQSA